MEQDVRLPFLDHDTVLLDLDPYAVKTYNLIQATIAINAVDSERKDQVPRLALIRPARVDQLCVGLPIPSSRML